MRQLYFQRPVFTLVLIGVVATLLTANPRNSAFGPDAVCLVVWIFTVFTEGIVVLIVARLRKKPAQRVILACALSNCITVAALTACVILAASFVQTLVAMMALLVAVAPAFLLFEAFFLRHYPGTRVSWKEALSFSAAMNLGSLAAGYGVLALLAQA